MTDVETIIAITAMFGFVMEFFLIIIASKLADIKILLKEIKHILEEKDDCR